MDTKIMAIAGYAFCAILFFGLSRSEAAYDDHIQLRVEGKHIVTSPAANPPNQIFVPVGSCIELDNRGNRFEQAAVFMKKHSLNTVRVMFRATNYKTNDAEYNFDSTLALILEWTAVARKHKLYTILDNHEYLGHNSICYTMFGDDSGAAVFEFWKSNFRKLALALKGDPWVIGFEPMNEIYTRRMTLDEIKAAIKDCARRIREVDSTRILFLPFHEIDNPEHFDVLDPPQIAVCPHAYPSNSGDGWTDPNHWAAGREAGNYPVLTTEFSAIQGFTYKRNKVWLGEFMQAVDSLNIGWLVFYYRPGGQTDNAASRSFGTVYGPEDPEIWRPTAVAMSEKYPIPNNGVGVKIHFDSIPEWFSTHTSTENELQLVLRVVDTTGSMVTSSNASVSVSVTGPATLANAPSSFQNGKATVTLKTTATPGDIVVSATSGSLSGSYALTSAKTWTGFQARKSDDSWADSGVAIDNYSPACRVTIRHPSKGINMKTARYEYTTDGGESWVYWDDTKSDEFSGTSLNTTKWTTVNHNTAGGSATVADGALTINAEGEDVWSTWENHWYVENITAKDEFTYVYEEQTGEFEVVTRILSQETAGTNGLAGIMVRDDIENTRHMGYCYVAATPDSGYVFAWKDLGSTVSGADKSTFKYIDARQYAGEVTYPCYLKISKVMHPAYFDGTKTGYNRRFHIYTGWYSTDGANWTKIKSRYIHQAGQTQKVGLFACSGVSGTYADAVFDFYRVSLKATPPATTMYSSGAEQFQTGIIPFLNTSKRQEVRFRINTVVPFLDYMNNGGDELVSPRYTVFDGEHVSVLPTASAASSLGLRAIASQGAVRMNFTVTNNERIGELRFAVYNLAGKIVWTNTVQRPGKAGAVVWQGRGGSAVPAGTYIIRMNARMADSGKTKTLQTVMVHSGR